MSFAENWSLLKVGLDPGNVASGSNPVLTVAKSAFRKPPDSGHSSTVLLAYLVGPRSDFFSGPPGIKAIPQPLPQFVDPTGQALVVRRVIHPGGAAPVRGLFRRYGADSRYFPGVRFLLFG